MTGMGGRTERRREVGQKRDNLFSCLILKQTIQIPPDQGHTHMSMFNFNYVHTPCTVSLETELQRMNFRGCNSVHNSTA